MNAKGLTAVVLAALVLSGCHHPQPQQQISTPKYDDAIRVVTKIRTSMENVDLEMGEATRLLEEFVPETDVFDLAKNKRLTSAYRSVIAWLNHMEVLEYIGHALNPSASRVGIPYNTEPAEWRYLCMAYDASRGRCKESCNEVLEILAEVQNDPGATRASRLSLK